MTTTRAIAHNTIIQISGKIASTLLGIVAFALMARTLGATQFGWYVTAAGFLQFIGIISDFGFTVTTSNLLAEPAFDKRDLLNTVFTWRFLTALLFQGLAPLLILFFPYPPVVKTAVAVVTFSFFANGLNQVFIGYYQQRLRLIIATLGELAGRVVLVGGIAAIAFLHAGFLPMVGAISLAAIVSTIYLWAKTPPIRFQLDRAISRALFHKMWPTALSVIANACYLQADRVILPLYVGAATVGFYGAAYRVLDIVIQIAAIGMGIIMPLITAAWSRRQWPEFKKYYQLSFDLLTLLILPIIAGLIVLAGPIMQFIAGKQFSGAGVILRWLAVSIVGTCFGMIFGHIALSINRQKQALWIYGSDAILSLLGYFHFIPLYGFYGAIGVTIFSEFYAGAGLAILTMYYARTWPHVGALAKIVLASFLMGWLVRSLQPLNLFLSIIIGGTCYILLILLFRVTTFRALLNLLPARNENREIAPLE